MRPASGPRSPASPPRMRPNAGQRRRREKRAQFFRRHVETGEFLPLRAARHRHLALEQRQLLVVHQPGVIVLVAGERQVIALDRIGDKTGRLVVGDGVKGVEHRAHVVPGEIGHQPRQRRVVVLVENGADAGIPVEVAPQMLAPPLAALVDERRIERIGARIDPLAQMVAVRPGKGGLQFAAVFQCDDAPAEHLEQRVDAAEQPVGDDGVEALAVVIDDPPEIAYVVLPAFQQRLEDVAFVEFGVAGQRDHAAGRLVGQAVQAQIVLHERGEQRDADAEPDRAGREIDEVAVLGARRISLSAAECAEALELLAALMTKQVVQRMKDRRGVRLHRDAVLRPQHVEVERRHQRRDRGGRRLMTADLEAVAARAQMVGVVDHPGGEPQHLLFQRFETGEPVAGRRGRNRPWLAPSARYRAQRHGCVSTDRNILRLLPDADNA